MSRSERAGFSSTVTTDSSWQGIYVAGGIAALLALAGMLIDIALTMVPGMAWNALVARKLFQLRAAHGERNPAVG